MLLLRSGRILLRAVLIVSLLITIDGWNLIKVLLSCRMGIQKNWSISLPLGSHSVATSDGSKFMQNQFEKARLIIFSMMNVPFNGGVY